MHQTGYVVATTRSGVNEKGRAALMVVALVAIAAAGAMVFAVDTGADSPDPAPFEETVSMGVSLEDELALDDEIELPRAQAFYSQYEYVVGYYGIETYVDERRQPGHLERFGYPLALYVSEYGTADVELNEDGYPVTETPTAWINAEDAWYVHGSDARTPAGEAMIPFADRADAESFAETYGGDVRSWETVLESPVDRDDAATVRDRVDQQNTTADDLVDGTTEHDDRPVSVTVGEDVDSVQAGIDEAPENTTVLVEEGTYNETLEIDRPITLRGEAGTTISGDGNGSVVTITEPDVAVRTLEIDGIGPTAHGAESVPGEEPEGWDDEFQISYTGSDAGITAHNAAGLSIADVRIDTPSNGVIIRDSPEAVVDNVTVQGPGDWSDALAGVMVFRSPGVIQDSTFTDGRDSVYLYSADGMVVRGNEIEGGLLGIHLMYTGDSILADNVLRGVDNTGIYIMTGPERNAVVGNHVSGSLSGIHVGGSDSYVADNWVEGNENGLRMEADSSIYEYNVMLGNDIGARDGTMLPTSQVVGNDFVANDEHATVGPGPLRIWTHDGTGNYWEGALSPVDGDPPERSYTPSDPVDATMHTTDGAPTLARSPALDAVAGLETAAQGMQSEQIVDRNPASEPNNSALLEATGTDASSDNDTERDQP